MTMNSPQRAGGRRRRDDLPVVLCVDDEARVLQGLSLNLRRVARVEVALGGAEALAFLQDNRDVAVIISDMRMPGMDGAAFLSRAVAVSPDATRVLLTGQADLPSAIRAVNDGQLFRFLTKPCPPDTLVQTVAAAVAQHRLVTAERVLLEQTLLGSVKTLTDVLSAVRPAAFGRADRIRALVDELLVEVPVSPKWPVEVAASVSQLGCVTLPEALVDKLYEGKPLSAKEDAMASRMVQTTLRFLDPIPRLEPVREMLAEAYRDASSTQAMPTDDGIRAGAELLRVALDFDNLDPFGDDAARAIGVLVGRGDRYDQSIVAALARLRGDESAALIIREVEPGELRVGMTLTEDVRTTTGALFVARGFVLTEVFVERFRNHAARLVTPLRVRLPKASPPALAGV